MNFRTCACGCGMQFRAIGRRKFATKGCRDRAYRHRKQARETIRGQITLHEPSWSRKAGGSGPLHVELIGVHEDYPGFRIAELLDLRGESLRIRYPGPDGGERIIDRDQVHGVVVEGQVLHEEAQHVLDALTWEAA
ncbi:MAG: hypothetical protein V3U30_02865 [Thermoplasmata archaeon]